MTVPAIEPVGLATNVTPAQQPLSARAGSVSFGRMMLDGIGKIDAQIKTSDQLAAAFAVDDSIPLHQVTFALEQARLSTELLLQVRNQLVEGYQEIMRMQL